MTHGTEGEEGVRGETPERRGGGGEIGAPRPRADVGATRGALLRPNALVLRRGREKGAKKKGHLQGLDPRKINSTGCIELATRFICNHTPTHAHAHTNIICHTPTYAHTNKILIADVTGTYKSCQLLVTWMAWFAFVMSVSPSSRR